MTELDRYLNHATRGLFGARRRAVREELHGNLVQHALDLQVSGLPPEDALRGALRAFGSPARVSQGFLRVHTLPVVVTGLLIASSVGTVALGVAVREAPARPSARCQAAQQAAPPAPPVPDCAGSRRNTPDQAAR